MQVVVKEFGCDQGVKEDLDVVDTAEDLVMVSSEGFNQGGLFQLAAKSERFSHP